MRGDPKEEEGESPGESREPRFSDPHSICLWVWEGPRHKAGSRVCHIRTHILGLQTLVCGSPFPKVKVQPGWLRMGLSQPCLAKLLSAYSPAGLTRMAGRP